MGEQLDAGPRLFEFVRFWSRRSTQLGNAATGRMGRNVILVEAVRALAKSGLVTINRIADEIGFDQSGASRLVQDATNSGYLTVTRSTVDERQREVYMTDAGEKLLEDAHEWQCQMFETLTIDWSAEERRSFAASLARLLESSRKLRF